MDKAAMKQIEIEIQNRTGLHARPAKVLVNLAKQFSADVQLVYAEKKANAKSMVSVLTLGAGHGSRIILQTDGADEETALVEIEAAFRSGLGDGDAAATPLQPAPAEAILPQEVPATERAGETSAEVLHAIPASPGIAIGPIFQFRKTEAELDPAAFSGEVKMGLREAMDCARAELSVLSQQMKNKRLASEAAIFEAHIELIEDPDLEEAVQARIQAGERALAAWHAAIDERAAAIAALPDRLIAARADDLRDVGRRVARLMLGQAEPDISLPDHPVILIARELSPSDTAVFDSRQVLGFGLVNGGPTSHIAILARAFGLPAIVKLDESILRLAEGTSVVLNANDGMLTISPDMETLERETTRQERWFAERRSAQEQATLPAVTVDGHAVDVTANAGSVKNAADAVKNGADGIGLLRTEFLFLDRATAPDEEEQFEIYAAIARIMSPRPTIIRTLDIGGDKPLPYIQLDAEMNPFLGERGIRLCLNRPELFKTQLRAILRAAPHGNLRIMFPMVADVTEVRRARALIETLCQEMDTPPVPIGIMIEIPSAALLAETIAPEIDFFSIGTNDLTQYTLAVDRAHPALAAMHDGLHPAVLRLIAHTIEAAHQYGKRVDLCGELGSDPLAIPILVGLGIDELSVSVPAVPTVKAQVRSLTLTDAQSLARQALACSTALEVRELVKKWRFQS